MACRILVPGALTTGRPGNSQGFFIFHFYFEKKSNLQKSCKNNSVNSQRSSSIFTSCSYFCYICFITLFTIYTIIIFLMNYLRANCRLLPLNIFIFAANSKDILLNNHSTIIKFRKFNIVKLLLSNLQFIFKFH